MSEPDANENESLRRHFEVERELARRLRHSTRAERTPLFRTLYDELFQRVPDHSRKLRREDPEATARAVEARLCLLEPFLPGVQTFLEFAPGDCTLAYAVCPRVSRVLAVDISDQTGSLSRPPANFKLLVYDGYHLDLPDQSVDLAFSYMFLEHIHPDDVEDHFRLIWRLLRPGGIYAFATPHRFSGPHDISRNFSDEPEGFHMREWSYRELTDITRRLGYERAGLYRQRKFYASPLVNRVNDLVEAGMDWLPRRWEKRLSRRLFTSVNMAIRKPGKA